MKGLYKFVFLMILIIAISSSQEMNAVPAYPKPIEFCQPDGSIINIIMRGDEKVRWAQTLDGYTILFNKEGAYEYATINDNGDLIPSGVVVRPTNTRTKSEEDFLSNLKKGLFFNAEQVSIMKQIWDIGKEESSKAFPTNGNRKLICILVGFKDKEFTKTHDDFDNLFNQVGYSTGGATGSVKDYYLENSYQQFNLTVDVAGPYTLSQNMSYYGANSATGSDSNPRLMAREGVMLANNDVNFADYDNDENGEVDGVYVIYAGYGEEAGGGDDAIWAHAWTFGVPTLNLDGKILNSYSCSAELRGNSGTNITAIGVICHEFGHVLGAPDYYDTNYETGGEFEGTGQWDIMAGGSWNNSGKTPAHHNVFTKVKIYEWARAKELSTGKTVVLRNVIDDSTSFYFYNTQTSNEYFLIEYREQKGFNEAIPGSGMLIFHVHSGVFSSMYSNSINNTHPQKMYPVCASAFTEPNSNPSSYGNINFASCAWTGLGGNTSFTDETIPSSKSWAGENTEKPITNIWRDEDAKTVTFDFMGGTTEAEDFIASPVSESQIDISWTISEGSEILLAYSETGEFGVPVDDTDYSAEESLPDDGVVLYQGTEAEFSHTNLKSRETYHYKIWLKLEENQWSEGVVTNATTLVQVIDSYPWVDSFEGEVAEFADWWLQNTIIEESEEWMVVAENEDNPSEAFHENYFALLKNTDSQDDNVQLVSPEFDLTSLKNAELSFWYFLEEKTGVQDELRVFCKGAADEEWSLIENAEFTESVAEWTKVTLSLPEPLTSSYYIAFEGYAKGGYGVCVDSIAVSGEEKALFSLTLTVEGNGGVEVNDVEYVEPLEIYEGTVLNLTAIPEFGWNFEGWTGDLEETDNPLEITIESDLSITATFVEKQKFSLEFTIEGNGTVEVDGEEYSDVLELYDGTEVTIEAIPDDQWSFDSWTGDITGTTNPQTYTISSNSAVTATFTQSTDVDIETSSEANVFPNPFNSSLTISNSRELSSITLTNLIGQKVLVVEPNGKELVHLSTGNLSKGIYLISLQKKNGERILRKLVKQ